MHANDPFRRFQELQQYVGWTDDDARQIQAIAKLLAPDLPILVDVCLWAVTAAVILALT